MDPFSQPQKILVIEDDPAVSRSLHDQLVSEGYQVVVEGTGAKGITSFQKDPPHLIILDVRLPDGSGFDFCLNLRDLGCHQPILILTVHEEDNFKVQGLENGADDYMTKPYNPRELTARIHALFRRAYGEYSASDMNQIFIKDIHIDLMSAAVSRNGIEIPLTPTEYRIFLRMAKHPGETVSRSQLVDVLWGANSEDTSENMAISVYIRRLREKLELDPAHPSLIMTVPGVGYRIIS
jgi:DNA-binding response OmpR family regulator